MYTVLLFEIVTAEERVHEASLPPSKVIGENPVEPT